ncbi:LEA domain protein [Talaromyces stipitatus ATCC 10500]|uniref:LEA domain protein n=1 Tax=Talaromyces stipitatus (strain ATCC 10500 / CBS 375.48 / QM 6759 / NRRL 1006) TaxID=441959 RepID=B8M6I2_TALSN|nr:LEA domain protein [Talaromyces stipitatus ATCC 10500]XP_002479879.1 LEA domain protein [Talaromyces stipitatus ATCC 10500]EED19444.1 LEA domain protein [Talaromyces stipitatus ATCC 10500]EED19445.1 LEA domain protein [Talaromyces stipitatus ATCC 10500]
MSFLTRVAPTRFAVTSTSFQAYRSFSTTLATQRGPVEATKDVLKKADRTVSDAAVKGIETGETLTHKAQETLGVKSKEAEGKAKEVAGEAKGKAHELEGKAKGKAEELRSGQ